MSNEKGTFGKAVKNILIGAALGAVATMTFTKSSMDKKLKNKAENALESVTSMFKMN